MNLAETAFGRFLFSDPMRCEVCKAWFGSGAGREVGDSRSDDFCVPPQHEESRLSPTSRPEHEAESKKPPEGGFWFFADSAPVSNGGRVCAPPGC